MHWLARNTILNVSTHPVRLSVRRFAHGIIHNFSKHRLIIVATDMPRFSFRDRFM